MRSTERNRHQELSVHVLRATEVGADTGVLHFTSHRWSDEAKQRDEREVPVMEILE